MNRRTYVTRAKFRCWCDGCDWNLESDNAMGVAARHHDATGHVVYVEIERHVRYGDSPQGEEDSG